MALKSVSEKKSSSAGVFRKCTELKAGETIAGYLTAFAANNFNEENKDFVLQDKSTGVKTRYTTAGTLKYDINDGLLVVGLYTEITCKADEQRKSQAGKAYTMSVFEAAQDDEDSIDEAMLDSFSAPPVTGVKAAVEQFSAKAKAEQLKSQLKAK